MLALMRLPNIGESKMIHYDGCYHVVGSDGGVLNANLTRDGARRLAIQWMMTYYQDEPIRVVTTEELRELQKRVRVTPRRRGPIGW